MNEKIVSLTRKLPRLNVDVAPEHLASWCADASGLCGDAPLAVVAPGDVDEVQALIIAARAAGLALQPVSSHGRHTRGDTLCGTDTAIVDLRRLNRVLRVDRRNRVAVFEAGVTFADLRPAVDRAGLRLLLPLAPRAGKSALAAYLEREPTIYPRFQWDASDPLLCTEVVFGTGERFRTGSAAGPGSLEDQWAAGAAQKSPMGPGQSDLMRVVQGAQGTIGIASWCSAKCEVRPPDETLHVLTAPSLDRLVRIAYGILRRNHADILFLADGNTLASLLARDRAAFEHTRPPEERWFLVYSVAAPLHFPEEKLAYVHRELGELTVRHEARPLTALPAGDPASLLRRLTRPEEHADLPYWRDTGLGATRELFFLTTLDRAGTFMPALHEVAVAHGINPRDFLTYIQPLVGGRMCHLEFAFPYDPDDRARASAIDVCVLEAARRVRGMGAFFSRPYGPITNIAFSGTSAAWLVPKVKRIFDPDGILSPNCLRIPETHAQGGNGHALQ